MELLPLNKFIFHSKESHNRSFVTFTSWLLQHETVSVSFLARLMIWKFCKVGHFVKIYMLTCCPVLQNTHNSLCSAHKGTLTIMHVLHACEYVRKKLHTLTQQGMNQLVHNSCNLNLKLDESTQNGGRSKPQQNFNGRMQKSQSLKVKYAYANKVAECLTSKKPWEVA